MKRIAFILLYLSFPFQCFSQWLDVSDGVMNGGITRMVVYEDKLWCAGGFSEAGTTFNLEGLATWNGHLWEGIFPGINGGSVLAFENYNDGKLYIGGNFHNNGIWIWGNKISRWNGANWENFTTGTSHLTDEIRWLTKYNNNLFAGGNFINISGVTSDRIAYWDGANWYPVGNNSLSVGDIFTMTAFQNELFVSGSISYADGLEARGVARWNGIKWNPVGKIGVYGNGISCFAVDTLRDLLYVAGGLTWADNDTGWAVAQWDGRRWSFINHHRFTGGRPYIEVYHNELYLSGIDRFVLPGGDTVLGVVKWDGRDWKPVEHLSVWNDSSGCRGQLIVYHDTLYLGGVCHFINGTIPANNIIRWYSPPDTGCDLLLNNFNKIWAKDTTYFCDSVIVAFDNNTTYADSWLWDFGDGQTDTVSAPYHTYDSAGTYNVSLITKFKYCTDTVCKTITAIPCDTLSATVYGHPDTIIMQNSGSNWYAIVYFISNIHDADLWWWDFGNGYKDSSVVSNYTYWTYYNTPGTYIITSVVKIGCCIKTVHDTIVIVNPSSIDEHDRKEDYLGQNIPNPFNSTTIIPYSVPQNSKSSLLITDVNGVFIEEHQLKPGENQMELSIKQFAGGIYFYSIKINGVVKQTRKMVLVK